MTRSIDGLPFFNDLGLLSLHYTILANGSEIFKGSQTDKLKSRDRLKTLILTLGSALSTKFDENKKS